MAMIYSQQRSNFHKYYWARQVEKIGKFCLSIVPLIAIAVGMLIFVIALLPPAVAKSLQAPKPAYSTLYEQLLEREKRGEIIEALRLVPIIHAAEDIPVDSFYTTLENKRRQLLEAVIEKDLPFGIGNGNLSCSSLHKIFQDHYMGRRESFQFVVDEADGLTFNRFCYLLIIEGREVKPSLTSSITNPESSWIDLQSALNSGDPWLISAALFVARKQYRPTISPQMVVNRWEKRPDLWDEQCTLQAMLYFALFDTKAHEALQISNEDIRMKLDELQPVPID